MQTSSAEQTATGMSEPAVANDGLWLRIGNIGRASLVGVLSGAAAGLVAGGLGARLAMRILAVAAGDGVQGIETDNGNIVGQITAGGTIFLVIFGAILGGFGGVIYIAVRRWLPGPPALRGIVYGVFLGLVAGGILVVHKDNQDFLILGVPVLSITLFALLPFFYGILQVPAASWLERRLPQAGAHGLAAWFYRACIVPAVMPALIVVGSDSEGVGSEGAGIFIPLLLYVLAALPTVQRLAGSMFARSKSPLATAAGNGILLVTAGVGAFLLFDSITYILKVRT